MNDEQRECLLQELYKLMPGNWRRGVNQEELERWRTEASIVLSKAAVASSAPAPLDRERLRTIVNNYDDRHEHLRGYYSLTDLLAIAKLVAEASAPATAALPQPNETFDDWWQRDGKFFDPDTDDVPWFDKRQFLAEYAWHRARQEKP